MPADVSETESYPTTVQGPAGGDARTATSVRNMGSLLASRTLWLKKRLEMIFGDFKIVEGVDATTDTITLTAHGYVNGDVLRMIAIGGSLPGGVLSSLALHVVNAAADTFQVSYVSGGPAADLTSTGSGTLVVFKVPQALDAVVHTAFTTLKGDTIPAGPLRATIAAYLMPTLGGTFTGEVTRSGDNATEVNRVGSLPDSSTTITVQTKDLWHCPDVTANRTTVLNDPPKAGLRSRIQRVAIAGGFSMTINRSAGAGSGTVGTLSTKCFLDVESYDAGDGLGLAWHGTGTASNLS